MQFRGIYIVFFAVLVALGCSVFVRPLSVARFLKPKGDLPSANFLKLWRALGLFVAVVSVVELVAVLGWSTLLR